MSAKLSPKPSSTAFLHRYSLKGFMRLGLACSAMAVATAACSGSIDGDGAGGTGSSPGEPADDQSPTNACSQPRSVGAGQWRRLTSSQYVNSVRDLLGQTADVSG